jgi:hypothetical protein
VSFIHYSCIHVHIIQSLAVYFSLEVKNKSNGRVELPAFILGVGMVTNSWGHYSQEKANSQNKIKREINPQKEKGYSDLFRGTIRT